MTKPLLIVLSILIFSISMALSSKKKSKYTNRNAPTYEVKNDSMFNLGKVLFKTHCSSCHYIGMDKTATAPALGGITKKRHKKWLYQYTRNPMQILQNGDSIAKVLRSKGWGLMPSFPKLTDSDLNTLYYFVEKRYQMSLNGIAIPIEFEFKPSENKRVKACTHVITKNKNILKASVSTQRFWRFSCGSASHKRKDWKNTTLKFLFTIDNSINAVSYLSSNTSATRINKDSEWDWVY